MRRTMLFNAKLFRPLAITIALGSQCRGGCNDFAVHAEIVSLAAENNFRVSYDGHQFLFSVIRSKIFSPPLH